jgi:exodeoxyribonuclease VII large subunit
VKMRERMRLELSESRSRLGPLEAHLVQLSPLKILDRGYAIVERDGKIVKSPEDAPKGSKIRVRVAKGEVRARVT